MRTDVLDLHDFYEGALGAVARRFIRERLAEAWSDGARFRVAGFGYTDPFLSIFGAAERAIAMAPQGQGVIRWQTAAGGNGATLVCDDRWPLPDASIDRLLIVHGLEEASDPRRLMREAWRVLAPDGRMIVVIAHRRGVWSLLETTPFAAGRPYLKGQLQRLLESAMFRPTAWSGSLYFPPLNWSLLLRAAPAWERAGAEFWPGLAGVLLVEAAKDMAAPVALAGERARARRVSVARPAVARPSAQRPALGPVNLHARSAPCAPRMPSAITAAVAAGDAEGDT